MNYRDNCTIIEVGSSCVKKTYLGAGRQSRVLFLRSIYLLLVEKAVPNVDKLIQSYEDHMDHGSAVYVGPRGVNVFPTSAQEVREAVVCILQALVVCLCQCVLCLILTRADLYIRFCMLVKPLFHRDIRWPNIIRDVVDRTKWFLVEWDDASTTPTRAAPHLDPDYHSPAVFSDNHESEVDLWGAGKFILDACAFVCGVSAEMIAIGERLVGGQIKMASEALGDVEALGVFFFLQTGRFC